MNLISSFYKILQNINGFTTPFFGLTWNTTKKQNTSKQKYSKNKAKKVFRKGIYNVTETEPKYISLLPDVQDFSKLVAKISLINAQNIMWRVGYKFIKESEPKQEYIFHVYQDQKNDTFHSRIVVLEFGKERQPDIHKRHIGVQNTKKFVLTLERNADEVSFFCDGIFLGKQNVLFSDITDINIGIWTHKNTTPISVLIENIRVWKEIAPRLSEAKISQTSSSINKITAKKEYWYEWWWVKQILFPLSILLLGGYLLYMFGWNGNFIAQNLKKSKFENATIKELSSSNRLNIKDSKLRALYPLETGKKLGELPNGTFFYATPIDIEFEINYPNSGYIKARSHDSSDYFEIQKDDSRYYLLGYISDETYSKISSIEMRSIFTIMFSNTWGGATKAVAIPFDKIYTIKSRMLDLDESKSVAVFDIGFKEALSNPSIHKNE